MNPSSETHADQAVIRHAESLYIDGKWLKPTGDEVAVVINPATEKAIAEVPLGSAHDTNLAVAAARRAFETWSQTTVDYRAALLERIHALIVERKEVFAQTIMREMGASISSARAAQVPAAADHVRVAREVLLDYEFITLKGKTAIAREPIGVCALITPWNWPLYQITAKVAPALAAGCTVIVKPSELSPLSALMFAQVVHDAGVPPGVFNLVPGSGLAVGETLSAHPDIDMVSITGSNRAGAQVATAAASTFKRVTQELGGKSPNLFLDDADYERAVPEAVNQGMRNAGQSCSAPTRMIVPRSRLAQVEQLIIDRVNRMVVGDPSADATEMGPIANRAQYDRVKDLLADGLKSGAKLICGGAGRPETLEHGYFVRPTVFSEVDPSMRIAQEEIFGPVICLMPYDGIDDGIRIANSTAYGLGSQVQGKDLDAARKAASRIRAGRVHINYPDQDYHAPFGGYKRSGNGREYGVYGFEEYLETKAILGYA